MVNEWIKILETYKNQGYIYDFHTVVDTANNTVDFYYKIDKPVEYIKLNFIVSKSNTSLFEEIVK
jgi:ribosomal protein S8